MKKINYILILSLILLGSINLGFSWGNNKEKKSSQKHNFGIINNLNLKKLNLSNEQKEKLKALQIKAERELVELQSKLRLAEIDLRELLDKEEIDLNKVELKIREIEHFRGNLRLSQIKLYQSIKDLLTKEQKEKLKSL